MACIAAACTGCLYIGPINPYLDENHPPEIVSYYDGTLSCEDLGVEGENMVCFAVDEQVIYLLARDPDEDALEFIWERSVNGLIYDAQSTVTGTAQSSFVTLFPEDVDDGEQIKCRVWDGSQSEQVQVWTVAVVE